MYVCRIACTVAQNWQVKYVCDYASTVHPIISTFAVCKIMLRSSLLMFCGFSLIKYGT